MEAPITLSALAPYLITTVFLLLVVEQLSYLFKKRHAPGPTLVLPFLGNAIPLVLNPTKFWDSQSQYSSSSPFGFSANYLIGRFILFIRDTDLSLKIFNNVKPEAFMLVGHPFGKKLFGDHNLIYMFGQEHKDLRARIAPNFTPKALSTYLHIQQRIILKHFERWAELASPTSSARPISMRLLVRDMNLETSQTVFVGPYLAKTERERFRIDYNLFNVGSMKLPVDLPGFAFRDARLAVDRLAQTLGKCARRSKDRMRGGAHEPECLIDFWMQETVKESPPPPHSSDRELGGFLFDFLFAAQDASTSSLLWAVALLESHPEVLSKVRAEVLRFRSKEILFTAEEIREMKYTQTVAREVLRIRAPATLAPHIAMRDFRLTEDYTIPKGTIVFPSIFESSFQGFTEPDRFDPDRFSEERREDESFKRNFLTFGAGAHQCVGQRYALNHLVLFIAMFVSAFDFKRHRTDGCDDIVYNPTICPKDGCTVFLSTRGAWNRGSHVALD